MRKYLLSLFVSMMALTMLITGCGEERERADVSIKTVCEAIFHQDETALAKVKLTKDEMQTTILDSMVKEFQANSGGIFTEDQAKKFGTAVLDMMKNVNFDTKVVSEDGDNAKVSITVDAFDINAALNENRLKQKLIERSANLITEEQVFEEISNILTEEMKNLKTNGTETLEIECKYDNNSKMWLPKDMDGFAEKLEKAIFKI